MVSEPQKPVNDVYWTTNSRTLPKNRRFPEKPGHFLYFKPLISY